ncbi:MarR family winged helix-turn-helix transcriptional regulator [Hoeflea poritis]|uniref:MarR family winged helix-turn-helix transcriptional regulator n=1 Tax=Hoeflea poritis TaxID=2993659 RepID=A0ABT4VL98_9HYPH|nr:MarR family winged helix-turn-helix transcriptional regulator [Hoeflea poritis]MDA4845440.1 MarR family winged helix-turn-helix transcriptional regulator [Hoeflea poritis]
METAIYPPEFDSDTPLQNVLTWRIHQVHNRLNVHAAKFLEKTSGIALAHWRVMLCIGADGNTTHSEIRRKIAMDKGQLSRCLKGMVDEGLVVTQEDAADQRQQRLSLTKKGRRIFDKTLPEMRKRQSYLIGRLSKSESRMIFSALDKLEVAAQNHEFL